MTMSRVHMLIGERAGVSWRAMYRPFESRPGDLRVRAEHRRRPELGALHVRPHLRDG